MHLPAAQLVSFLAYVRMAPCHVSIMSSGDRCKKNASQKASA